MPIQQIITDAKNYFEKSIQHLESELTKVRAGKVSTSLLDGIMIDYYGSHMPINQASNVSIADARTLVIQPWEKNMLPVIEKAILAANIGITPHNDGMVIKLYQPPLTEERRKEYVKKAHGLAEIARVSIRSIRRDALEHLKKLTKEHVSEDQVKDGERDLQDLTNKYITTVDKHLATKEKEIMTV